MVWNSPQEILKCGPNNSSQSANSTQHDYQPAYDDQGGEAEYNFQCNFHSLFTCCTRTRRAKRAVAGPLLFYPAPADNG